MIVCKETNEQGQDIEISVIIIIQELSWVCQRNSTNVKSIAYYWYIPYIVLKITIDMLA